MSRANTSQATAANNAAAAETSEATIETWIPASKVKGNHTVVKATDETEDRAGVKFVKVYVKA